VTDLIAPCESVPDLAVCIVSWNTLELLRDCLESVFRQAGKLVLEREPTDLAALVEQVVADARVLSERHPISVVTPPTLVALVDPVRLEQVLTNLLENAAKYAPAGTPITVADFQTLRTRCKFIALMPQWHFLNFLVEHGPDGPQVAWRANDQVPPSGRYIGSPYDAEARYATKGAPVWSGYKVHLTETCDDPVGQDTAGQRPNLITNVATTDATVPDAKMTEPVHAALAGRERFGGAVNAGRGRQLLRNHRIWGRSFLQVVGHPTGVRNNF